jgi:mannose-6-phosphate isomerase-like protein (cupin superfamily)
MPFGLQSSFRSKPVSKHVRRLVILHGSGVANIEGHPDVPLTERMLAYIPPATRHNVTNNGSQVVEYIWVVAPTRQAAPK